MKEILVYRHGKSDWDAPYGTDHERPLAARGRKAAAKMGQHLSKIGRVPELVISSDATRAAETAKLTIESGEWECDLVFSAGLYGCSVADSIREIQAAPDRYSRLMLVGHNPTWSLLVGSLIGGGEQRMPTAAVALIAFSTTEWKGVRAGQGELIMLLPPRLL